MGPNPLQRKARLECRSLTLSNWRFRSCNFHFLSFWFWFWFWFRFRFWNFSKPLSLTLLFLPFFKSFFFYFYYYYNFLFNTILNSDLTPGSSFIFEVDKTELIQHDVLKTLRLAINTHKGIACTDPGCGYFLSNWKRHVSRNHRTPPTKEQEEVVNALMISVNVTDYEPKVPVQGLRVFEGYICDCGKAFGTVNSLKTHKSKEHINDIGHHTGHYQAKSFNNFFEVYIFFAYLFVNLPFHKFVHFFLFFVFFSLSFFSLSFFPSFFFFFFFFEKNAIKHQNRWICQ